MSLAVLLHVTESCSCISFSQWSIKLHSGSSESLLQYKANLTSIAAPLEKLTEHSEVFWVVQGVYQRWTFIKCEEHLKERKDCLIIVSLAFPCV